MKAWGDRALPVVSWRSASPPPKKLHEDPQIQALREAIARVKGEYDAVVETGGSHVRRPVACM